MFIFIEKTAAQDAINRSVQVSTKFETNPDRLEFTWPWDWSEGGYTIFKKHPDSLTWGQPIGTLPWGATEFSDDSVSTTQPFEYAFYKKGFEKIERTVDVPQGETLIFTINNLYGNGLCCNFGHGWYLLQACGNTLAGGSDFGFGKKDTIAICDSGNPTEPLTITINPDMLTNNTWWTLTTLNGQVIDSSGVPGTSLAERPKFGYILAGPDQSLLDHRGTLLLVIDDEYSLPLQSEIEQLEQDIWGDGWRVKKLEVNRGDSVTAVKSLIVNEFEQTPDLKMVYLLGHVPVPYSGNFHADGHIESHWGAWPADVYYGEMDGDWTDNSVTNTSATFSRNHNLPGDGKFDQSDIPTPVELAVGRVDLFDMPAFGLNDVELTRRYLQKAHLFKTGQVAVPRRALVDDNLGIALGAPAASGWRNFAPMFTADSVASLDYFSTMKNEGYLWSFGGGSGSFTSANGVGTTQEFANDTLKNIFTMLCGSYFGDWDNPDAFLRAPLASPGWTLTSSWAGNPPFTLHRMAMGEPIGLGLLRTQNATEADYYPGPQLVHTALMGDPTLRLHPVKPVENLTATVQGQGFELHWSPPAGEVISHYLVYRFDSLAADFVNISQVVLDTFFVDAVGPLEDRLYMVRAVKWETSGSGSYWNLSLGSFVETIDPCAGQNILEEQFVSICEGQTFEWNGSTYTQSGIYEQIFPSVSGCDSLVRVFLDVEYSPIVSTILTICEGENIMIGDSVLMEPGNHEIILTDSLGCIQHWGVLLIVKANYEIEIDSNYIPPIVIGGVSHSDDFTFSFTFSSVDGCDSIVNYNFHPLVGSSEEVAEQCINVFPNPSNGHFIIENKMPSEPLDVEVWDRVGRLVFAEKTKVVERSKFDISELPSGVYWLKIRLLGEIFAKRIVLMR
ncbi:MAG: T9SS type A sorting domain-containing protein [Saprospiraceae bacterium]|nr:T9SS type A sorting domain-containing protein [Saprospiraceae bacterium]MCF8251959.1 T9SS type A sorting domain-containing protein [Saprospiraceae bacterium]MCF8282768.1 T9SS type A sorting domain-containing protein [Bacteroidales bacterium]MCF8313637.1 T9SS type A sorting domain-containing protein [Saprospiraceae bacterium]MCF8442344.1 T9SS type A sorting domain-containing protein [Saprospiraceae bacterium]